MLRKILFIIVLATIGLFYISGCKDSSNEAESGQEVVKTAAEYEAEAKEQITKENMDEELDKIEKALEQEITEEP